MTTASQQVYKSKGGYVPRGPERWKRARIAALEQPHTEHARKYWERVRIATEATKSYNGWAFVFVEEKTPQKRYYACSAFCAAMSAQLLTDWDEPILKEKFEDLLLLGEGVSYYTHDHIEFQSPPYRPNRRVICFHCGGKHRGPAGDEAAWEENRRTTFARPPEEIQVVAVPEPEPEKTPDNRYVLVNGVLWNLAVLEANAVELTDEEVGLVDELTQGDHDRANRLIKAFVNRALR